MYVRLGELSVRVWTCWRAFALPRRTRMGFYSLALQDLLESALRYVRGRSQPL